jgi:hypothetical protein
VPPAIATRVHDTVHDSGTVTFGTHGTGTAQNFQAPFDDFTPTASVALRSLEWQGYYCNRAFVGSDIPGAAATQFIIRIAPHNPATDMPAYSAFPASASSETQVITVPASAVLQQLETTRLDSPCGSRNGGDPAALYKFTTHFASPIPVTGGRRYWISITATVPDAPPVSWHWRFGRRDNGTSRFCLCGQNATTLTTFHDDRAFALFY